jgi:predicted transcriptional regulator
MESLPSSIEAYLEEAGFSGTEIIVLKKLLEEDALTLRELAGKTGKSTGVLDQAVKKLMKKRILSREMINDIPKYALKSLHTIVAWMEDDMKVKQDMMSRRQENFESFVRSLTVSKRRPEMEHFEGVEGMKIAYKNLLGRGNDIVQYGPTIYLAEEDPLRDFRVQFFRDRRNRGVFSRVITHNTVLGRRFLSRDPFEYRRTILVDPEAYPFHFEKIICGDTVGCFQLEDQIACLIKYPELAEDERRFFERIWNKKISHENIPSESDQPAAKKELLPVIDIKPSVPFSTKTLSQVREFFLSKRSIAAFVVCALLAGTVTYGLYRQNIYLNTKRIQEKVLSIASTGAIQFDANDLNELHTTEDIHKPQWSKVIYQLNEIRRQNEGVKFAYIMRIKNNDLKTLEFVADADSLDPFAKKDLNNDGRYDEKDALSPPGDPYNTREIGDESIIKAFQGIPAFDEKPYTDQWGTWISGNAPIKDEKGNIVAVFAVDVAADEVNNLSRNTFLPILYFIGFFLLFVFIRLTAFNRSLFLELYELFKVKKLLITLGISAIVAIGITAIFYYQSIHTNIERIRERVTSIATTGALQFSIDDLSQLHSLQDTQKPEYTKVVGLLHQIRVQNENIKYAYLIRPKLNTTTFEFIADADAHNRDLMDKNDVNFDGIVDDADDIGYPGLPYDISYINVLKDNKYNEPISTESAYTDKWGTVLTGYAPIKSESGEVVAILAIDIDASQIYALNNGTITPLYIFIVFFVLFLLFKTPGFKKTLLHDLFKRVSSRKVLISLISTLMIIYWLVFGLYFYTLHLIKDETGKRLMSIAVTAASEINPDDLESLHFARDMKREEYQRVFTKLANVRRKNPDITYVYIFRPTEQEGMWEFVVDADSNFYIPFLEIDYDNNGIIDDADENVAPGIRYDMKKLSSIQNEGLLKPTYERGVYIDQWGEFVTGSAPIYKDGKGIAVLGIDMNAIDAFKKVKSKFYIPLILLLILSTISSLYFFYWNYWSISQKKDLMAN